ncbi:MAG: hypothetical protein JW751_15660 [Polyangiaceae bacterium]|nr:hypothetical protein [Polyangiaceae bacterium]
MERLSRSLPFVLALSLVRPVFAEAPPSPAPVPEAASTLPVVPPPVLGREDLEPPPDPWFIGAQVGFGTGLAPHWGGRAAVFVERSKRREPAMRLGLVLQPNRGEAAGIDFRHTVYAFRVELCSPPVGTPTLEWRGCGAADGGVVVTGATADDSSSAHDSSSWGALGLHARLRQWLGARIGVEGEVGGLFPLSQYTVVVGGVERFRDRAGLSLALGVVSQFD